MLRGISVKYEFANDFVFFNTFNSSYTVKVTDVIGESES